MLVAFAHAAAVQDHRVIEQRSVAVGRGRELVQELREQRDVTGVELDEIRDLLRVVAVMRHGVVRLGDAEIGVDALAGVAAHHEGEDARDVRFVSQREQIELQRDVLVETIRGRRWARPAPLPRSSACFSARWMRCSISRTLSR